MARGVRRSIDDEIAKVDVQIEKCSQELTNLQEQRKQLVKQKEQADLDLIYSFVKKSGKSVSEFLSELTPSQESA